MIVQISCGFLMGINERIRVVTFVDSAFEVKYKLKPLLNRFPLSFFSIW